MSCGSCGTGKPNGCKGNGDCGSGSCNRLNVYDWLANLPFTDPESSCRIVEVSFKNGSRKDFFRNTTLQYFNKGDKVTVEGVGGFDVGEVSISGEMVRLQLKKRGVSEFSPDIKKILRPSTEKDLALYEHSKSREKEIQMRSRAIARQLNLQMKISEVEVQADGRKATFFYTADDRVDFREMIKIFASEFKVKVEMRQIGIRQEAGKVGGIGSCGRELCCSTWLTDFKSVTTTAARYQNLSINQTKLSGQCGRLKCCLNYELDTYLDALQQFPNHAETLETTKGRATLVKKDIFKNLMWYTLPDSNKQYPLTIARVKEIQQLNSKGEKVEELHYVELQSSKETVEIDAGFVDVVGQISLRSLERSDKKRKNRENNRNNNNNNRNNREPNGGNAKRQQPNARNDKGKQRSQPGNPNQPQNNSGRNNNNGNNKRQANNKQQNGGRPYNNNNRNRNRPNNPGGPNKDSANGEKPQ